MISALLLLAWVGPGLQSSGPLDLKPMGVVKHPPIDEMSGVVRSRTYEGIYWVHNDSGDSARIWPIRLDGTVAMSADSTGFWANVPESGKKQWEGIPVLGAKNVDWEDIAIDGKTLYVSDLGNNANARRDLGVYVVPEPNPESSDAARASKFMPVRYPDQTMFPPATWHYDCESIFILKHKLYAITKHRKDGSYLLPEDSATLYRLDTEFTDKPNVLTKLDFRSGLGGWVTGADVSDDGKTLAVLCSAPVASIWFFDISRSGDAMLNAPSKRVLLKGARQAEGICFGDAKHVIVTNEQRDIFRVDVP